MYNVPPHYTPKGPRSPWKYIAIGGAACAVCAVIGGVTAVALVRTRSDVRAKATAAASVDPIRGAGATTLPAPLTDVVDTSLPEEPAAPGGTPTASLRKRPAWGKLDHTRSGNETVTEYAPQLDRADAAFVTGSPLPADGVDRALLVCRVQTFAKADAFAGDDLQVRIAFGHTPLVVNDGPEDKNLGYVSAPLATLKKGETVRFEVFDRDVWELEVITMPQTTWNGGALNVLDPGATIECRSVSGEPLQKLVSANSADADRAIRGLQTKKLDPTSSNWGFPDFEIVGAQRGVGNVAGLVGWDDPHAARRVAALDAATAALLAQKPGVFDGLHGSASGSATIGKLTAANLRMECGPSGASCTIHVTIENHAEKALSFTSYDGLGLYVATRDSGPHGAAFAHPNKAELGAGESIDLTIEPEQSLVLGTAPAILGVCLASRCQPIKLH